MRAAKDDELDAADEDLASDEEVHVSGDELREDVENLESAVEREMKNE